jgi:NAD(P)-dependent dehydrogenase (short-subunit alcohol dehydrogenase family)
VFGLFVVFLCFLLQVSEAVRKALPVDLLINNAGVAFCESFLETSIEHWDTTMNVNVRAAFVAGQLVAKDMISRGVKGAIVNVSSQASMVALNEHTSYCVSKGALDQLTRMMALELGKHGIRVNSVNPTVVLTDMGARAWGDPAKAGPMLAKIPLNKFAEVEDVVNAISFLLSSSAAMVNGVMLPIDGGFLSSR